MSDLISYPFRIGPNGHVVTRPEDSIEYYEELLAILLLTKPGERPQVPLFGVNDPAFATIEEHELLAKIEIFGPPIRIINLDTTYVTETQQNVVAEFALADFGTATTTPGS